MYFLYQLSSAIIGALLYALKAILVTLLASIYNFLKLLPPLYDACIDLLFDLRVLHFIDATFVALFSTIGLAIQLVFVGLSETINALLEGLDIGFNKGVVSVLDNIFSLANFSEFSSLWKESPASTDTQPINEFHHPEFEVQINPSMLRPDELAPQFGVLALTLLSELPKADEKLALQQFDALRLQQLKQLQSTWDRYTTLYQKLFETQTALATGEDFPTELICDEATEDPCLFVKQYQDNGQWLAVPGSTRIDGKSSIIKIIEHGTNPYNLDEQIQKPDLYDNKPTRFCWHQYNNNVGISQELDQCSKKIQSLVTALQTNPTLTQPWTKTQAGQMYPPPPPYKKPEVDVRYSPSLVH